jgi:hypothetical protein
MAPRGDSRYAGVMKHARRLSLPAVAGFAAATVLAGAACAQSAAPSQPVSSNPGGRDVTSAAETPLRNANLVKEKIPPVLTEAMAAPYAVPHPLTCRVIAQDVDALTAALGPDFDAGAATGKTEFAPTAVSVAANTLIPFQGVVRLLSGADAHARLVARAIIAGSSRRSYLKGLGETHRCGPPAAPERPLTRHVRHRRKG